MRRVCMTRPPSRGAHADTMAFSVILETCVLYPAHVRDTVPSLDLVSEYWHSDLGVVNESGELLEHAACLPPMLIYSAKSHRLPR